MKTKTKEYKKVGYVVTQQAIEMLAELAKDYRNNKSYALEEAIKLMFNLKNNKNETKNT